MANISAQNPRKSVGDWTQLDLVIGDSVTVTVVKNGVSQTKVFNIDCNTFSGAIGIRGDIT